MIHQNGPEYIYCSLKFLFLCLIGPEKYPKIDPKLKSQKIFMIIVENKYSFNFSIKTIQQITMVEKGLRKFFSKLMVTQCSSAFSRKSLQTQR